MIICVPRSEKNAVIVTGYFSILTETADSAFTILGTTGEKCVPSTNSKQTLPRHFSFSNAAISAVFSSTVAMRFSLAFFSFSPNKRQMFSTFGEIS